MTGAGAVARRELGSLLCRPGTHLVQGLVVAALGAAFALSLRSCCDADGLISASRLSDAGRQLHRLLLVAELLLVTLAAPLVTGGLIAGERRRGTYDLLRLTRLGEGEILLAKFAARMAYLLLLVAVASPLLFACLPFGGVAAHEVFDGTLLVAVAGLWAGALGVLASALCREPLVAILWTYGLLLVQGAGLPLALAAWSPGVLGRSPGILFWSPPAYAFLRIQNVAATPAEGRVEALWSAFLTLDLVVALLVVAVLALRRLPEQPRAAVEPAVDPLEELPGEARSRAAWWGKTALYGVMVVAVAGVLLTFREVSERTHTAAGVPLMALAAVGARMLRSRSGRWDLRPPMWDQPVAWREVGLARSRLAYAGVSLSLALIGGSLYLAMACGGRMSAEPAFHGAWVTAEFALALVLAALFGVGAFAREAEEGHLDLLRSTPLPAADVLAGKLAGAGMAVAPIAGFAMFHALAAGLFAPAAAARPLLAALTIAAFLAFHLCLGLLIGMRTHSLVAGFGLHVGCLLGAYVVLPGALGAIDPQVAGWGDLVWPVFDPLGQVYGALVGLGAPRPENRLVFLALHVAGALAAVRAAHTAYEAGRGGSEA
ncbi:MAG: ABC transporter permease subunit [Planctomycetes bacterium]|nr:ABC transporter permease subunit [Planctomycetota bacterium]